MVFPPVNCFGACRVSKSLSAVSYNACSVLACVAVAAWAALRPEMCAADSVSVMYGIDDAAEIIQVTMTQTGSSYTASFRSVFNTGMAGQANAFAYDTARDQMFFVSSSAPGGSFSPKSLYLWDRGASLTLLATEAQAQVGTTIPANAVFYNDAFWFFQQNATANLVRVNLSYSGGLPSWSGTTDVFQITDYPTTFGYGDIAIDAGGILYGATSGTGGSAAFFSLDVSGTTPTNYQLLKATGNPGLQIAFSPDYSILYGQDFADGKWYTINKATGDVADISVTTPVEFRLRDLGGSSFTAVPEPSALAIGVIGLGAWAALGRRRIVGGGSPAAGAAQGR